MTSYSRGPWQYDVETNTLSAFLCTLNNIPSPLKASFAQLIKGEQTSITEGDVTSLRTAMAQSFPPDLIDKAIKGLNVEFATAAVSQKASSSNTTTPEPATLSLTENGHVTATSVAASNLGVVEIGPWFYIPVTDDVFFDQQKVELHHNQHRMLKCIIETYPKPVNTRAMSAELWGADEETQRQKNETVYKALLGSLERLHPGASMHLMQRDFRGFRISPTPGAARPDQTSPDLLIRKGPWVYDTDRDMIFFRNKKLDLKKRLHHTMTALIKSYPVPLSAKELQEQVYGTDVPYDPGEPLSRQRLYVETHKYIPRFLANHPDAAPPIFFSPPVEAYTLEMQFDDIPEEFHEEIDLEQSGPFTISIAHGRAWHNKQPLINFGRKTWLIFRNFVECKNQFIPTRELTEIINQTGNDSTHTIKSLIKNLRSILNNIEPSLGDRHIRAAQRLGYGLFETEADYRQALVRQGKIKAIAPVSAL